MANVKVAYNACYGGFSLSREGVLLGRELSGDPKWGGCMLKGELYDDGSGLATNDYGHLDYDFPRTDPVLIEVIEKLGKKANGTYASLAIAKVPKGEKYRIDEYDGVESVMRPDDYEWQVA